MTPKALQIFCGTWNVNGKDIKENLDPWLLPSGLSPDLYAIGFQEFDLTRDSFVSIDEKRVLRWDQAIQNSLQKSANYVQIGRQQLVGMLIILYAKESLASEVVDLDSDLIGTGYAGIFGNKGGVGIRFRIGNDTFCFVNSHLNAHVHNVERRNNDYKSIISRMVFVPRQSTGTNKPQPSMELPADFVSDDRETESSLEVPPIEENKVLKDGEISVFDHTHFFWMGDLNYRIDMERELLFQHITGQNWAPLQEADQLKREIAKGSVFEKFTEGPLEFIPTYKFDAGTDNFDSSKKKRLPAFCDRVLWREDAAIQSLIYRSHMELKVSDHKPVSAVVNVKLLPVSTTPTKKPQAESSTSPTTTTTSPPSSTASSSKEANGLTRSGFPKKSYFYTTGIRFAKNMAKSPSTYVVGAIVLAVISYFFLRS